MRTLIALSYSPWSEKARWALDHHRVEHRFEEYAPMIGEPLLRLRTRKFRGRISVPVLLDDGRAYLDSFDIARRAEELGRSAPLFPRDAATQIEAWNRRSESALSAARALLLDRIARDDEALRESFPSFMPQVARGVLRPIAQRGVAFLARKYVTERDVERHTRTLRDALVAFRADLGKKPYFLDEFSYADVVAAVVLQFVRPVDERFIHLGAASRKAWSLFDDDREFDDLVAWRDALYARHRHARA